MTTVVAAFDVDGTLTIRDCVRPFLERVAGRRRIVTAMLRRPVATIVAAARRDRDRFKEIIVGGALRGKLITEVDAIGEQFAQYVLVNWLRPDTLRRLRWHQQAGHRTVIVSASLAAYLRPLGIAPRHRRRAVHRLDAVRRSVRRPARRAELPCRREAPPARPVAGGAALGRTQRCGRTATAPATASCWPAPTTPCGSTVRPSRRSPRWSLDDGSPPPAGTPEAVGQEPAGVRRARRRRRARPDGRRCGATIVIFVAFCLASSGTYFWNDLLDVENDRNHPTKQHRPIASGAIPVGVGRVVGTLLLARRHRARRHDPAGRRPWSSPRTSC